MVGATTWSLGQADTCVSAGISSLTTTLDISSGIVLTWSIYGTTDTTTCGKGNYKFPCLTDINGALNYPHPSAVTPTCEVTITISFSSPELVFLGTEIA